MFETIAVLFVFALIFIWAYIDDRRKRNGNTKEDIMNETKIKREQILKRYITYKEYTTGNFVPEVGEIYHFYVFEKTVNYRKLGLSYDKFMRVEESDLAEYERFKRLKLYYVFFASRYEYGSKTWGITTMSAKTPKEYLARYTNGDVMPISKSEYEELISKGFTKRNRNRKKSW